MVKLSLRSADLFNVQNSVNVIHHVNRSRRKSLDYINYCRKAFDKIQLIYDKTLRDIKIEVPELDKECLFLKTL